MQYGDRGSIKCVTKQSTLESGSQPEHMWRACPIIQWTFSGDNIGPCQMLVFSGGLTEYPVGSAS